MSKETFKNILLSFCHMKETINFPLALNDYSALLNQVFEEKETKIAVLERALELAVSDKCKYENLMVEGIVGKGAKVAIPKKEQWYKEQAESEIKNEKE